ncbi:MAG: EAL domain-containing protein [Burkholderiales bacterium]
MEATPLRRLAALKVLASREALALLTFALAMSLSVGGWTIYSALEEEIARNRFDGRVNEMSLRIRERLLGYEQILQGALGFMASSDEVTRGEWRDYTDHLRLDETYPGIQGVGFAERVRPHELASHIERVRAEGFPDYRVWPEGEREDYFPTVYLEPFSGRNLSAFGYDMYSEPVRRQAMQHAGDTGKSTITRKVRLVQETDEDVQSGFLMYLPFYARGSSPAAIDERRVALAGYVYAPFRMADLLQGILAGRYDNLDLEIFDGLEISDEARLYDSRPDDRRKPLFTRQVALDIYGHAWTLKVASLPEFELTVDNEKPRLVLLAGALVSLLLAGIVWALAMNRDKATALVRVNRDLHAEIDEHRRTGDSLRILDRAIKATVNPVVITDPNQADNPIVYVNPAFEAVTGYSAQEAVGRNCRFLQGDDRDQPELERMRVLLREQQEGAIVLRNYRKDGRPFWNEMRVAPVRDSTGHVTHFVGFLKDITETRNYQQQLEHHATHDALTGLANRSLLQDRIEQAIRHAARNRSQVAIVFVDLDHFNLINDGLGHDAGDLVLKEIAARLVECFRQVDTVARIGGDEFALILSDLVRMEDVSDKLERVMPNLVAPLTVHAHELGITCSIGVSVYPEDGADAETLQRNAEAAMHRAKQQGRNTMRFYKPEMNESAGLRLTMASKLRQALKNEEFVLHYQPRIDLRTGATVGVEALIRWQHPELGLLGPVQFIPLAEETGQIIQIGEWVLRGACFQNEAFRRAGLPPLRMSVNLSARQLAQKGLAELVRRVLEESSLRPELLEVEITESMVMYDVARAIELLDAFENMGVGIAIDDFGTGYSSLAYLKRFPIGHLKIDKSFVRDISTNPDDATIVMAIISLAHSLDMRVTAEGVETDEQRTFLNLAKCDEAQGYFFSKPVPAGEIETMLRRQAK